MKTLLLILASALLFGASCQKDVTDPQVDPAELLIGKWKLTSVYYFDTKQGQYVREEQTDPNYFIYDFSKSDSLFTYYFDESGDKNLCPHVRKYEIGKFLAESNFTLANQFKIYSDCPGHNDAAIVSGFSVTKDILLVESPVPIVKYSYSRVK